MPLLYKLAQLQRSFKDGREDPANGKWFARVVSLGIIDTPMLAEECSYSTTVTKADCLAVLHALSKVIISKLQESYSVRLDGLGLFKLGIKCTGAVEAGDFSASTNITSVHANFTPEYNIDTATGQRLCAMTKGVKIKETPKNAVGAE